MRRLLAGGAKESAHAHREQPPYEADGEDHGDNSG